MYVGSVCLGQVTAPEKQSPNPPASPQSVGARIDVQGSEKYLLGPGDVLEIRFMGQPEMNTLAQVDSEGNLSSLPFIDKPILAKCRSDKEVLKDVVTAYRRLIKNPQVTISISQRNSRTPAAVFGAVRQPARVEMQHKVRLNELLAVSGGLTERAAGTIQILHTEPLMCPGPGEETQAAEIESTNMPLRVVKIADIRSGKTAANPVIRPGDYIMVTEAEPVYVTGSVVAPGGIYLKDELKLSKVLGMVGGPRKEANISAVTIYRQIPDSPLQIIHADLDAIRKNKTPDVSLQPYDVIDVPEANPFGGRRLGKTLLEILTGGLNSLVTSSLPYRVL